LGGCVWCRFCGETTAQRPEGAERGVDPEMGETTAQRPGGVERGVDPEMWEALGMGVGRGGWGRGGCLWGGWRRTRRSTMW
jgi:hypothetical protein